MDNCNNKVSNGSILNDELGDAGAYSLCGLCALLFVKQFPDDRHRWVSSINFCVSLKAYCLKLI